MFESSNYPKPLSEEQFEEWLESGREQKIGYNFLLILWDEFESEYRPVYSEERAEIGNYEPLGTGGGREFLVAAYDLYSESRLT